jgi:hypothetical protein
VKTRHTRPLGPPALARFAIAAGVTTLAAVVPVVGAATANTIQAFSRTCAGIAADFASLVNCNTDSHIGTTPQFASTSRGVSFSSASGGVNFGANSSATASLNSFGLFAFAGGSATGQNVNIGFGAQGNAGVQFIDTLNIAGGSGTGRIQIPWLIDGGVDVSGNGTVVFAAGTCASYPAGTINVAFCTPNRAPDVLKTDTSYEELWILDFAFEFGVDYTFQQCFGLSTGTGDPLGSFAQGNFAHTGLMQPVRVFDSLGNLVLNPVITAESGLDYLNPQGDTPSAVSEPASLASLALGLLGVAGLRKRRRDQAFV